MFSVAAVVVAHWLAHEVLELASTARGPFFIAGLALVALVALFVIAVPLWAHRFEHHPRQAWMGAIGFASMLLLLDLAALAVPMFAPKPTGTLAVLCVVVAGGFLFVLARLTIQHKERVRTVRVLRAYRWSPVVLRSPGDALAVPQRRTLTAASATHLIVLLSPPNVDLTFNDDAAGSCTFRGRGAQAEVTAVVNCGMTIEGAIGRLNDLRPNWQQLLRGVAPHVGTLKSVILVGSARATGAGASATPGASDTGPEMRGSAHFMGQAQRLLRFFVGQHVALDCRASVDFDDVEALTETVRRLVDELIAAGAAHVVIETTGGYKTTSIVGAVATLNTDVTFQYVATNEPHAVWLHDLRIDGPLEM